MKSSDNVWKAPVYKRLLIRGVPFAQATYPWHVADYGRSNAAGSRRPSTIYRKAAVGERRYDFFSPRYTLTAAESNRTTRGP